VDVFCQNCFYRTILCVSAEAERLIIIIISEGGGGEEIGMEFSFVIAQQ